MKLSSAFIAIVALVGAGANAQSQCSSNGLRKEIRSLSPQEWGRVSSVLRTMQSSGWLGWFSYLHNQNYLIVHGNELFFPWHRRYVRDFESIGQQIDRNFVLPYWDVLRDYANPAGSAVLSGNYLGSNGQAGQCVRDGLQNGWTMSFPNNHCLRRQYNGGNRINAWYSPEYIQSVLSRSTRMSQLRPGIEFSLHGAIHLGVGGDMLQTYSPNDFVFWLHHANIDRLWSVWQTMNPNQNFWSMDGVDNHGRPMGYGTRIPHYNDPVINTMRQGVNGMCFLYDNGGSVSNTRRSLMDKRDNTKKCIARPPVSMPALVEGVFDDVNAVPVPADTYVQTTIAQKVPVAVLDKWFPTYTPGVAPNNTASYSAVDIPSTPLYSNTPPLDNAVNKCRNSSLRNPSAVYSEEYHVFGPVKEGKSGPKYPMPNPFPNTNSFIKMHNYPISEIQKQYDLAREFVGDMNAAGYQSPFAKGATA
ncbi:hypothetical protein GGF42_005799 [Coemansia sp. RSA 2424]|nr:hypothetical protein GGF42_005799 [Coemansia sp. RSA 2424]